MPTADKVITFTVTSSTTPPWIAESSLAVGTWAQISGATPSHGLSATNTLNSSGVKPTDTGFYGNDGHNAVCSAWAGAVLASGYGPYGSLMISNGGHQNYYGNEVYAFDLGNRSWTRITEPYPNADGGFITDGWWPANGLQVNGSPAVTHTYDFNQYHPGRNSFYVVRTQANSEGPVNLRQVGELPLSTRVWIKRGQTSQSMASAGWGAYDSTRDQFVYRGGQGASVSPRTIAYFPATDSFVIHNTSGGSTISQSNSTAAYDPVNDVIVVFNGSTGALYGLNPASLTTAPVLLNEVSAPAKGTAVGFEYSPALGGFVYYVSGAAVYKIVKGSGSWQTAQWTWTNLLSGSNTVTPENMEVNGVYSKFRIASYGSTDIAVVVKRTGATGTGGVYAFRLT